MATDSGDVFGGGAGPIDADAWEWEDDGDEDRLIRRLTDITYRL